MRLHKQALIHSPSVTSSEIPASSAANLSTPFESGGYTCRVFFYVINNHIRAFHDDNDPTSSLFPRGFRRFFFMRTSRFTSGHVRSALISRGRQYINHNLTKVNRVKRQASLTYVIIQLSSSPYLSLVVSDYILTS